MPESIKPILVKSTLALCISQSLIASTFAQENAKTEEEKNARLEEIVITARKRAESLQDVPMSVTAVSADKLEKAGIDNIEALTSHLTNIHFTQTGFSTQVRVRGIGSDNSQGFEQSVGMYMDGIYYGRAQLFRAPMMDMERAELLRGPQGILLGKNSSAGALNLTTAKPTDEFYASIAGSFEQEYGGSEFNGVISSPMPGYEDLKTRLAIRTFEEDGYFTNTFKDRDEAAVEEFAIRGTIDWQVTDDFALTLKGERNTFDTKGRAIEITQDTNLTPGGPSFDSILRGGLDQPGFDSELNYVRQTNTFETSENEINNLTLTGSYDFNDHTLTFISGILDFSYEELCDCDFIAIEAIPLLLNDDYNQFSQEIRIASPDNELFTWLAGVFYQSYEQEFSDLFSVNDDNLIPTLNASLAPILNTGVDRQFTQDSKSWALFGQFTWNINDSTRATLGVRYTEEEKNSTKSIAITDTERNTITDPAAGAVYWNALGIENESSPYTNGGQKISGNRKESAFIPQLSAEWDINSDNMLYTSFTKGFKAGGFDPRSNVFGATANTPLGTPEEILVAERLNNDKRFYEFENENATSYEIGSKSTLANGKLELNVTLFHSDFKDLQISQFDGQVGFNVGNADARTQGVEIDGRWLINEQWHSSYGISLLDFEYTDYVNGNCHSGQIPDGIDTDGDGNLDTCNYTGKRGVYTPKYTLNYTLNYNNQLTNDIEFISFIDLQHIAEQMVHVNLDPQGQIDAYTMLGARIGLETELWSVGILGKNLLDEEVISYTGNVPLSDSFFGTNTHYSFVRRGRTVSLEGKIKF